MRSYKESLQEHDGTGSAKAGSDALLAALCRSLAGIHAINPALVYAGAKKRRLSPKDLAALAVTDPVALGDLMFV